MSGNIIVAHSDALTGYWEADGFVVNHLHPKPGAAVDEFPEAVPGEDLVEVHSPTSATITRVWTCACGETCTTEETCHPSELHS